MSTQTAFLYPSTAAVLRTAGVGIIGHDFTSDTIGRECFVLKLDTVIGTGTLTDDVDGVLTLRLVDGEVGAAAIQSLADAVEDGDPQLLESALDDLLTSATTAFRSGLAVHKDGVAIEVTSDLAVLVAETADLGGSDGLVDFDDLS